MSVNPWLAFFLRRLVGLVAILGGLLSATFLMIRLVPGDPARILAGFASTEKNVELIRHILGLDKPLWQQYLTYVADVLHGNLGYSFYTNQTVGSLIAQRAPSSIELAAVALVLMMLVSIPGGILLAAFTREGRHRSAEGVFTGLSSVLGAVPEFLMATFLAFIFAVGLRVLPVAGEEGWSSLVLPVLAISLRPTAILMRLVRVETLNVLSQDYIRTARSKRIRPLLVYLRHVLPNVLTAAVTVGGLLFAGLIGGAVVVENVFARNGLGTALVGSVLARDYNVVQGIVLVLGVAVVAVNTLVDVILALVDPRSLTRQI